jgi:hypothetical protein
MTIRDPERISLAGHHEHRGPARARRAEFSGPSRPRRVGSARGLQRKRQRDDGASADRDGGAAGHPRAVAPATLHEGDARGQFAQRDHDLDPGGVLPGGRAGRAAAPDPIRLRDSRHHPAQPHRGVAHGQHIRRLDATSRTVGEREQEARRGAVPVELSARESGLGDDLHRTILLIDRRRPDRRRA